MELKTGMKLTRHVDRVKKEFKSLVGLPKNATNVDVLQQIGWVFENNGIGAEFNDYMTKQGLTASHGIKLVEEI
jgi:hypothetical protein